MIYSVLVVYNFRAEKQRVENLDVPADTSDRYNRNAYRFDSIIDGTERSLGIGKRRRELCAMAKGHVLEASVGTGRNMTYYPLTKGVKSVTMVDKSREMVEVARQKWPDEGNAWFIHAAFRVQDAAERVPCPSKNGFDTIVQTMGLCSTAEPEKLLKNLGEMTNPDGGRILLLEHGRGTWRLVNWALDWTSKIQADKYGCWHNKNIGEIVEKSGLEIVEEKRYNLGTTWWYVLKPPKKIPAEATTTEQPVSHSRSGWTTTLLSWLR